MHRTLYRQWRWVFDLRRRLRLCHAGEEEYLGQLLGRMDRIRILWRVECTVGYVLDLHKFTSLCILQNLLIRKPTLDVYDMQKLKGNENE